MRSLFATKIQDALDFHESLGKSTKPHAAYLRGFDNFCAEQYPKESLLTKEIAWDWVYNPLHKNQSAAYYRIRALNLFGGYLSATGEGAYVFPDAMTSTMYMLSPHIFTDNELRRFFAAADSFPRNPWNPFQHRIVPVVFRLIYTCGLRPNEGRELKSANIDLENGEILITNTKYQKQRIVVMSGDMLELCRSYARRRDKEASTESPYFFPARHGGCYGTQQFGTLFNKCWHRANPDVAELPSARTYDLRHRFASAVLNRWIDEKRDLYAMLPYLRAYMGHSDLSATEYYVHLLPENLVKSPGINWSGLESLIPEV